jgi:hypothetical protein
MLAFSKVSGCKNASGAVSAFHLRTELICCVAGGVVKAVCPMQRQAAPLLPVPPCTKAGENTDLNLHLPLFPSVSLPAHAYVALIAC